MNIDLDELDKIDDHQQEYLLELIDFLAGWLVNHILKMDTKIGSFERESDISSRLREESSL